MNAELYQQYAERNEVKREEIAALFPDDWTVERRIHWGPDGGVTLRIVSAGGHEFDNVEDALAVLPDYLEAEEYRKSQRNR